MSRRGELEERVMQLLWASPQPLSVADAQAALAQERELAYTTVMTVLDRLAKKDMVTRELVDRAWRYRAAEPQSVAVSREICEIVESLPPEVRLETLRRICERLGDADRAAIAEVVGQPESSLRG